MVVAGRTAAGLVCRSFVAGAELVGKDRISVSLVLPQRVSGERGKQGQDGEDRWRMGLDGMERQRFAVKIRDYASGLRWCGDSRAVRDGKRIHAHIIRSGHEKDRFLGNLLVEMYGKCGILENARAVFERIRKRNVFSWSLMIVACARNGLDKQALELFWQMQREGVKPDRVIFVSVLGICAYLAYLTEGKVIHACIIASGFESNVVLETSLVDMYGKCGSPADARRVFDNMRRRDEVSWNVMIAAYGQNGLGKEALELLHMMQHEGMNPGSITFASILDVCASLTFLAEGRVTHASIIASGFEMDIVLGTALVNMYGKCGNLDEARSVFDKICPRDVVIWTVMIAAYCQKGKAKQALELSRQMWQEGVKLDSITFVSILDACASLAARAEGKVIHASIVTSGFQPNVALETALVNMYGKCGSLGDARRVFNKMHKRNVLSWTTMIAAYGQNGHGKDALKLLRQMQEEGIKPDCITFVCVLDACASIAALTEGMAIHANILASGLDSDVVLGNSLISMYGKCGSLDNAKSVFDKMCRLDVVSWNAMISACGQNGHGKVALELFQQMKQEGLQPDNITFVSILDVCASVAALTEGKSIHSSIVACELESDVVLGNSLVHMYGKCGSLEDASSVFDNMPCRDLVSWNAIIAVYGQNGYGKDALELFWRMQLEDVKPDSTTFICILSACSHSGLVEEGRSYFASMSRDYDIILIADHYGCMVDILGRAGLLDDAEDLINNMPFQPGAIEWGTLLGACRIHGDVERGIHVAEHLFELDPKNALPYVLLSNIHAAASRWEDVANVRKSMEDRGARKQPGYSWIEVKDRVHEFLAGDKSHPEERDIC